MASTATGASPSSSGFGKKRQKKGQRLEVTNVAESTRIRVAQVLEQFRASNDEGILIEFDTSLFIYLFM